MAGCPNCNKAIGANNLLLDGEQVDLINKTLELGSRGYCMACGSGLYSEALRKAGLSTADPREELLRLLPSVPVLSLPMPAGWDYKPLTIVTAQAVLGTGIVAEVISDFTDAFGLPSGTYVNLLRDAERACLAALRLECLDAGGNAVIGVDVDYSQMGGAKAMIMVCMTGTAVLLADTSVLEEADRDSLAEAQELRASLKQ